MKFKLVTAVLLPAIYVILVILLKLSNCIFPKNTHYQIELKENIEIRIIKELHNFNNSQHEVPIFKKTD